MKNKFIYLVVATMAVLFTSCSEEPFKEIGEGKLLLHTSVNTHMEVITRAIEDEIKESCMVWISNDKGLVRRYNNASELPSDAISLVGGNYIAEAWAGDSVPASFDKIWYKGVKEFIVESGKTTEVDLVCKVANVGVSIKYDENLESILTDFTMTVGHTGKSGKLIYAGREDENKRGYFMMPSFDKDLTYELKGKQMDGTDFSFSGEIRNVKPATEYVLNVLCNEQSNEVGGAVFTIVIDENEIEITNEIQIVSSPIIRGYDFDINNPIVAEESQVGTKTVYVSSATKVNDIVLESDLFRSIGEFENEIDVNLLAMRPAIKTALENFGIIFVNNYDEEKDETLSKIVFDSQLTDNLKNGEYSVKISAVDKNNRSATATMRFNITDAPVVTKPMPDEAIKSIGHFSATLYGQVTKDGTEKVGFNYRKVGDSKWIYVEGQANTRSFDANTQYTATLNDLEDGTEYEYAAVSDEFVSPVTERFKTLECIQLPNASFEDWCDKGAAKVPGSSYSSTFWDTGNHGSTSLGASYNITTPSTDYVHSGNYSACLQTKYVVLKLAAGNIFAGNYLRTNGTNGEIGFGRPFVGKPKSVKMWIKYIPGTNRRGSGKYIKPGMADEGQIYIALTDNQTKTYDFNNEFKNTQWPFIIKTATGELFDKTASNVIAYGERIFTEATEGEGLIQIEIPLDYNRDELPSYIVFVASASRYGDYFEGCDNSTLYLDDIELIYK